MGGLLAQPMDRGAFLLQEWLGFRTLERTWAAQLERSFRTLDCDSCGELIKSNASIIIIQTYLQDRERVTATAAVLGGGG